MNFCAIFGRLTDNPVLGTMTIHGDTEKRTIPVCNFTVAVNKKRNGKTKTTFFRVAQPGACAKSSAEWLVKGQQVLVKGEIDIDDKYKELKIWAESVEFGGRPLNAGTTDDGYAEPDEDEELNL